jgi:hypothetical protein
MTEYIPIHPKILEHSIELLEYTQQRLDYLESTVINKEQSEICRGLQSVVGAAIVQLDNEKERGTITTEENKNNG